MAETLKVIKTIIVIRNDTEENLIANGDNLILRQGEMCWTISKDVNVPSKLKVGNGTSNWNELPYVNFNGGGTPGEPGTTYTFDNKLFKLTGNLVSLIGADTATAGQSFKISEDGNSIIWFTPANTDDVEANKTLLENLETKLNDNYYNKEQTDELVAKVFKFKGTKTSKAELEAITDAKVGDVWTVKEAGSPEGNLYVYAEDENGKGYWEDFPLTVDLSNYVLVSDFKVLEDKVTGIETNVGTLQTDVDGLKTNVDTLNTNVETLTTDVADLKDKVDSITGGDTEGLQQLTEKVEAIDTYVESVKPTINSLPDTIFSALEIQTLQNGDMRILGTHINKDTDGSYNIGGETILATLKAVTPNGNPGLMTGEDKAKLDKLFDVVENGGEPNVIEDIKVGGESLEVNSVDKSVNIPVAGEKLGVVKNYTGDEETKPQNVVVVDEDGVMTVPEVNVESLVQTGDWVIDGGGAIGSGGAGA